MGHSIPMFRLLSLQRSLKAELSLIIPLNQLDAFCSAAQMIDTTTETGLPKEMEKYHAAIETCYDLLGGLMMLCTTTDLFYGRVLLPLPALHAEWIPSGLQRRRESGSAAKWAS